VRRDDREELLERKFVALAVATGGRLYDCRNLPALGYGEVPSVYTSVEFERLAAANGPFLNKLFVAFADVEIFTRAIKRFSSP
jgi:heterodisulfide reductase subunit A-like polyferredoxin